METRRRSQRFDVEPRNDVFQRRPLVQRCKNGNRRRRRQHRDHSSEKTERWLVPKHGAL